MDAFRRHRRLMRFVGIVLPGDLSTRGRLLVRLQFLFNSSLFIYYIICFFLGTLWLAKDYPLVPQMIVAVSLFIGSTCYAKLILIIRYRYEIRDLIEQLKGFKPESYVGRVTSKTIIAYETAGVSYIITQALINFIYCPDFCLPFPVWKPYSTENSLLARMVFFFSVYYIAGLCWLITVITDTLFLNISNQICHKLDIITKILNTIGLPSNEIEASIAIERKTNENILKYCIKEHIKYIKMVHTISKIMNEAFVYQGINSFIVILVGLTIFAKSPDLLHDVINYVGAMFVVLVQVLLACWAGELIKSKFIKQTFSCLTLMYQVLGIN